MDYDKYKIQREAYLDDALKAIEDMKRDHDKRIELLKKRVDVLEDKARSLREINEGK